MSEEKSVFILGDFNDNLFAGNNRMAKIIKNNELTQIIDKPTRVTPTSSTLLDLAITNNPNAVCSWDVVPQEIADHDLISMVIDISKPKRLPVVRAFCHLGHYTRETFCSRLVQNLHNFDLILHTDDVNTQVYIFNVSFFNCLDECAAYVTKELTRPSAPWMNDSSREAGRIKNDFRMRLKLDRYNIDLQEQYKHMKKQTKSLIGKRKADFYQNEFYENRGNT